MPWKMQWKSFHIVSVLGYSLHSLLLTSWQHPSYFQRHEISTCKMWYKRHIASEQGIFLQAKCCLWQFYCTVVSLHGSLFPQKCKIWKEKKGREREGGISNKDWLLKGKRKIQWSLRRKETGESQGVRGRERKERRININKRSGCYLTGQNSWIVIQKTL